MFRNQHAQLHTIMLYLLLGTLRLRNQAEIGHWSPENVCLQWWFPYPCTQNIPLNEWWSTFLKQGTSCAARDITKEPHIIFCECITTENSQTDRPKKKAKGRHDWADRGSKGEIGLTSGSRRGGGYLPELVQGLQEGSRWDFKQCEDSKQGRNFPPSHLYFGLVLLGDHSGQAAGIFGSGQY